MASPEDKSDEAPKPTKDSQRRTPKNIKKRGLTHIEKVGSPLTKAEKERDKAIKAGQKQLDLFGEQNAFVQLYLPNLLHQVGRLVSRLHDFKSIKDLQNMPRQSIVRGVA